MISLSITNIDYYQYTIMEYNISTPTMVLQ